MNIKELEDALHMRLKYHNNEYYAIEIYYEYIDFLYKNTNINIVNLYNSFKKSNLTHTHDRIIKLITNMVNINIGDSSPYIINFNDPQIKTILRTAKIKILLNKY